MLTLVSDLRFGLRLLVRSPGFALAAVLTLALGIGGNTTILALMEATLLRPLPFDSPEDLVMAGQREGSDAVGNVGYTTYEDWRDRVASFEQFAALRSWNPTLARPDGASRLAGMLVAWNYFRTLGIEPALGRDFQQAEDRPNHNRVVVLTDVAWRTRLAGDPNVVGSSLELNGLDYRVIGILPSGFAPLISESFYERAEVYGVLGYDQSLSWACRDCQHLKAVARIRSDVDLEAATTELAEVQAQMLRAHPSTYSRDPAALDPLTERLLGASRPLLNVLLLAVGLVLLIACANVAHLMIARTSQRRGELAVRSALGASRGRLATQLVAETSLVTALGVILGLVASVACLALVRAGGLPFDLPRLEAATLSPRVAGAAILMTIAVTLALGLLTSLSLRRSPNLGSGALAGRHTGRVRTTLVATDVALAVCLLVASVLMLRSAHRLITVDAGFDRQSVVTANLSLVGPSWREDVDVLAFIESLEAKVRALPGVEEAALASQIPLGGNYDSWGLDVEGRVLEHEAEAPSPQRYGVTPRYFQTLRIPLLQGRLIDERDRPGTELVMVVNETAAKKIWPGEEPIGQRVRIGGDSAPWRTIVGIVGDLRHFDLAAAPPMQMYVPETQFTDSYLVLLVRSELDPEVLVPALRESVANLASAVPLWNVATLEHLAKSSAATTRWISYALTGFAIVALLMTALGIHGLVAFWVARRTREVGIRMALGADRRDVLRLVLSQGLRPIALGAVIGLLASLAVGRLLRSLLFEVSPTDPTTLLVVLPVLLIIATIAVLAPARRAVKVNPNRALHHE